MTKKTAEKSLKKFLLLALGGVVLVFGITLILKEWDQVVVVFRGVIGMALALAGLLILMLVKD